jgi:hypothetical protein
MELFLSLLLSVNGRAHFENREQERDHHKTNQGADDQNHGRGEQ